MADFNSSLPIRTEADGDAVVKITGDDAANQAAVNADKELLTKSKVTDGTDNLAVNADGSINVIIQGGIQATEKQVYGTTVAGVPNTPSDVVNYTVTAGKTFVIRKFGAAGSGKLKVELRVGPAAAEVTKQTAFTSTASPNYDNELPSPIEVAAGDKILVTVTNKDTANQDLYAYVNGNEVG